MSTHKVIVTFEMEEMTGSPEESAEVLLDLYVADEVTVVNVFAYEVIPTDTDQFDYGDDEVNDEVRRGSMSALSINAPPRPKTTKEMEAEANLIARDERWRPIIPMHGNALEKFEAECAEFVRDAEEDQG